MCVEAALCLPHTVNLIPVSASWILFFLHSSHHLSLFTQHSHHLCLRHSFTSTSELNLFQILPTTESSFSQGLTSETREWPLPFHATIPMVNKDTYISSVYIDFVFNLFLWLLLCMQYMVFFVCLSHASIIVKLLNVGSLKQWLIFCCQKISENSNRGLQMKMGVGQIWQFWTNSSVYLAICTNCTQFPLKVNRNACAYFI